MRSSLLRRIEPRLPTNIHPELSALRRSTFRLPENQAAFLFIENLGFDFEIFASGEYARLPEQQWAEP
jgi:hypothetical protein